MRVSSGTRLVHLVFICWSIGCGLASAADPPTIPAVRIADGILPPVIDGRVTDEVWSQVEPFSTFTQQDPMEGAPATERTEVRVLFNRSHLYIGVICFDSEPGKIIVSQARRD